MRWDDLFDDLESQLEQELGAEDVDLLAEEERLRLGRLTLRDRLLAMTRPGEGPLPAPTNSGSPSATGSLPVWPSARSGATGW